MNQEANINDGGEETSGAMTINNEVFDETHINYISILFSFAQPNANFYYTQRRQAIQQIVEGAASNNRVYLQESKTR